ncbi:hypothetical protein [Cellulomonas sp. C5510]|uniref:hypothetical protein n=1 Tax=Cellulomonas sp. C5510 TaxID=2871170 RepID=UPI001C979D0F|nr:hypothetical protein [Cellulomonas sp. C5510]QZN84998.1 hypothetical protein K5O09_14495 [Cellulomonas sp. C5510]
MDTVYGLLVVLHLVGWAIVLGGCLVTLRQPAFPKGALHGALTALVTGIVMTGLRAAEVGDLEPPDNAKIAVKLVVALVVTGLVWFGTRRPDRVSRGLVGATLGLTLLNVLVAVLWR